jgi:DNA polymerase I
MLGWGGPIGPPLLLQGAKVPDSVILIDSMAYIFRAYYSRRDGERLGPEGQPTGASFGFLDFLLRLITRENPSHIAAVFDSGPKSFRNEIFPDYKANRDATPEDLLPQFAQCEALAAAVGLPVFKLENHEADDLLATLAVLCSAEGREVKIISGDKDLAQLVDDKVSVHDPSRNRRFTTRTVPKHFGVRPDQMVDYLALAGDPSDNVPGVRGVGPKTASALLEAHADLDAVYGALDSIAELPIRGAKTLGARLAEHRDSAYLSRELVTLKRDLPLGAGSADLLYAGAHRDRCETLFDELGFKHVLPFIQSWRGE